MTNEIRKLDTNFGITSMNEALKFADFICRSNFCPASFLGEGNNVVYPPERARANVAIAIMTGMELGLSPLNSLRSICIIKGTPTIWGTAKTALPLQQGKIKSLEYKYLGEESKPNWTCEVTIVRKDNDMSFTASFSWADAVRAELTNKNNWKYYPKKMLFNRAKQTALSELFPECYYNIYSSEEIEELPMRNITPEQNTTVESVANNKIEDNKQSLTKQQEAEDNKQSLTKQQEALVKSGWANKKIMDSYREVLGETIDDEIAEETSQDTTNTDEEMIDNLFK
jgi:hypothetical protein